MNNSRSTRCFSSSLKKCVLKIVSNTAVSLIEISRVNLSATRESHDDCHVTSKFTVQLYQHCPRLGKKLSRSKSQSDYPVTH